MKKAIFAAALFTALASSGSAFADRWVQPNNGSLSAVTMPDGDVMMKIQLPASVFQVINRDLKANDKTCVIKEVYTGSPNTMILVCGTAGATVQ